MLAPMFWRSFWQGEAAKGRVLLLYSWGRKGKNGLYENQQKVLVVKNQLMVQCLRHHF